jgi:hypothetical protein
MFVREAKEEDEDEENKHKTLGRCTYDDAHNTCLSISMCIYIDPDEIYRLISHHEFSFLSLDMFRCLSLLFFFYFDFFFLFLFFFISFSRLLHAQFDRVRRCVVWDRIMNHSQIEEENNVGDI